MRKGRLREVKSQAQLLMAVEPSHQAAEPPCQGNFELRHGLGFGFGNEVIINAFYLVCSLYQLTV